MWKISLFFILEKCLVLIAFSIVSKALYRKPHCRLIFQKQMMNISKYLYVFLFRKRNVNWSWACHSINGESIYQQSIENYLKPDYTDFHHFLPSPLFATESSQQTSLQFLNITVNHKSIYQWHSKKSN